MSQSKSAKALRDVLRSHKASELDAGGEVIEIDSTTSAIDAANILWEHNILGAPVWNAKEKKYVGFFDMRDILSAVTATAKKWCHHAKSGTGDQGLYNSIMVDSLAGLKVVQTRDGPPGHLTVTYLAARNPFCSCTPDSTLEDLCRVLSEQRSHRIPIVPAGGDGRCTGIISQSALIKFLSAHVSMQALDESLQQAGLQYKKKMISVVDSAAAYEAFELLDSHRLSGIAVVDEDGRLVGNTSARDIKLAACDKGHNAMDTDILSYLAKVRQATPMKNERYPSCHVHEECTVGHVVGLLAKTGYHRVFVVDKNVKPVGVISVADVIRFAIGNGK